MSRSFYLGTEAELATGSAAFSTKITATPSAFGLLPADASSYAALDALYQTAYSVAADPETRNKGKIAAKALARRNLKLAAADLAKKIEGTATVTDEQKIDLGLSVRSMPSPIPIPSTSPVIEVISVNAWTVKIRLRDSAGTHRGRAPGTIGASVFSYVGATAPTDIASWKFEGSIGRVTKVNVTFDNSLPAGTKVFLTSFWFNGRKQSGPPTPPVSANLPGGSVALAA